MIARPKIRIPAKAGIQSRKLARGGAFGAAYRVWTPACAGVLVVWHG